MKRKAFSILGIAVFFIFSVSVYAESPGHLVQDYVLLWDPLTKRGEVQINADNDQRPEEKIRVESITELSAWGSFLSENVVHIRVSGSKRLYVAAKKKQPEGAH